MIPGLRGQANAREAGNPKHEYLSPKQTRMTETVVARPWLAGFEHWDFGDWDFFRI